MTTEQDRASFEAWLKGRPPIIQEMARDMPAYTCYRHTENRGHYRIYSYSEDGTVTIVHGTDSYLPGVAAFGQDPNKLTRCDCGQWAPPTHEQTEATRASITSVAKLREAGLWPCRDERCANAAHDHEDRDKQRGGK